MFQTETFFFKKIEEIAPMAHKNNNMLNEEGKKCDLWNVSYFGKKY